MYQSHIPEDHDIMSLWKRLLAGFLVLFGAFIATSLADINAGFFTGLGVALFGLGWLVVRK